MFRLRVTNARFGGVEVSADRGATWHLLARVARPALKSAIGGASSLPEVLRSSAEGLAFGIGGGKLVKLLPDNQFNRRDEAAILVNMPRTFALFRDFLPPAGSPVQQVIPDGVAAPLAAGYSPAEDDVLLFTARRSDIPSAKLAGYAKDAAEIYRDTSISRVRAQGKAPISGFLEVTGRIAPGDDPPAVAFVLDGKVKGISNRAPYTLKLDTREMANGEHLLEIRGLDAKGATVTKARHLIVVQNPAA